MAISLIRPVQLPVIPDAKESDNALNYLVFVAREGRIIGLKSPISLFFSLLLGSGPPETGLQGLRAPPLRYSLRRTLGENALECAPMHVELARRFRDVSTARFADALNVLPAHAIGRHRRFASDRTVEATRHQG